MPRSKNLLLFQFKNECIILIIISLISSFGFAQDETLPRKIKLKEAIELGIQNSNQIKLVNTDVAIANENLSQASIAKAPMIGLNMGYNYIGDPKIYEGFYETQINVDYLNHQGYGNIAAIMPLYYGGVINNQIYKK